MPALVQTEYYGTIAWLGRVADREAALASVPLDSLTLTFAGPEGEAHGGLTRPSCARVTSQYPKGTEIRNVRQLSILSTEDLTAIAQEMGVERVDPTWVGATIVLSGLSDFTYLPPSSRLQAESGATFVVDMENRPCHLPAKVIDETHPGVGKLFKAAAKGRRGVTAWVEREGSVTLGEKVRLHVPGQRAWSP